MSVIHQPLRDFQRTLLRRNLWDKQVQICDAMEKYHSVSIKGCHGSGKTFTVAGAVPWDLFLDDESIVITTAPTLRQVKLMWNEIETAILALPGRNLPERSTTGWKLGEMNYAIGFSSSKGVNAQGFHGKRVRIIADEAIGISSDLWDAIEGIRAAGDVRIVKLCNPTVPSGPVFDDFTRGRGDVHCITISAFDTPNLAGLTIESLLQLSEEDLDFAPFPWLTRRRWVKEMYYKWGPNNPRYRSRVLGEFPTQSQWSVFSLEWIERAKREPTAAEMARSEGCFIQVGIDVAAGGDDETTACARVNGIIIARGAWSEADPRGHLAQWLSQIQGRWQLGPVIVDTVGVGHYIALHLADQGFDVRSFKAGASPMDTEQFANAKAEAYFRLRDMYKADYVSHLENALDEDCDAQKSAIEYRERSNGQILVEPKEEARKRGVLSPDRAEAEVMAFCKVVPRQVTVDMTDYQTISSI
ncbi:MAG: hypothetical protein WA618_06700 [Terriglobales bacterium]